MLLSIHVYTMVYMYVLCTVDINYTIQAHITYNITYAHILINTCTYIICCDLYNMLCSIQSTYVYTMVYYVHHAYVCGMHHVGNVCMYRPVWVALY